ncbi:kinase-like protein [Hypoxylon sp. FL1284]|nr:kinase-like protein [Hypoxylon sp. FL1284]
MRECITCGRNLPQSSYSANQYSRGVGRSRCAACVHGHPADVPSAGDFDSGRYNDAHEAEFSDYDFENPFAEGGFRWVAKATYTAGARRGEKCVLKWFKWGAVFEADYFILDIKATDKALEIVNRFNELNIVNKVVKINVPEVWTISSGRYTDQRTLCEPFIQNYQKFNSNTGWTYEARTWGEVMQALSHFSYHVSGGQFVLCDLQGGVYRREVVLSDPVILSRNRDYGVTDLGPDGISSFFSYHVCNDYCRSNWTKPGNARPVFRPVAGTTMMRRDVSTRDSRSGN